MGAMCSNPANTTLDDSRERSDTGTQLKSKEINLEAFKFEKVIGRGSFGKVFMVKKISTGKYYAMKVLSKEAIESRNQKKHTMSEREILEMAKSPFVVSLHYAFQTQDKLYFVMDLCNGGELFYHLRKDVRFSEKRTKFYAAEIILALEALHQGGIIYRDLKPENVLLEGDGHIKITDFGLSKQGIDDQMGKKAFTFCGTPEYLAPEIIKRSGHDKSVDWWSLGALIYEMLAGRPPFYNKNRNQMLKNIVEKSVDMKPYFTDDAQSLLTNLLIHDPKARLGSGPTDAEELKIHPFFSSIDWDKLEKKELAVPFRPKVKGSDDYKNFDKMFTEEKVVDTPVVSNINSEQKKNNYYDGFTYVDGKPIIHDLPEMTDPTNLEKSHREKLSQMMFVFQQLYYK